jgi:hypothetical protein
MRLTAQEVISGMGCGCASHKAPPGCAAMRYHTYAARRCRSATVVRNLAALTARPRETSVQHG